MYVLALASGDVTRLTYDDANELVSGWSPDSQSVLFQSNSHEISGMLDVYRVGVEGGTPMPVAADRYTTEYFAAPSPGGESVAITARANAASQWWRKGHSHLDESEIWIVRPAAAGAGPRYEQLTRGGAKDAWPMWAAGGKGLYLMSDRSGAQNIWAISSLGVQGDTQAGAKAVTTFTDGRVLWPSITRDGRTIAFERDFGIWTVDTASGQSQQVAIALRGAPAAASVEHRTFSDQLQELSLSPDGRKAAFTVHGEVFSISARDGGDAVRVTETAAEESEISWAPDSRRLAYVSDRDGTNHLFVYDFGTGKETQLTTGMGRDNAPRFSPDGKWMAFERNSKELRVIDPATKEEKLLATGAFDTPPFLDARDFVWSPDSRFVAFLTAGTKTFQNVHVVAAAGGEARPVSFLANSNAGSLVVEPRRQLPDVCDLAAYRAGRGDARGPAASHAEVPRGPVPRSVPRRAAEDDACRAVRSCRSRPSCLSCPGGREAPGGDRVRRDPPPRDVSAGGCRRGAAGDQPGRQMAAADRERGRPAEPLRVSRSTSCRRSRPSRASSPRRPARSGARISPPTARRSTTWIADASST